MKSLKTLIRLQKQRVDELRKKMTVLETQKFQLIAKSEEIAAELERELLLASTQVEMGGFFGDFADRIRKRREEIAESVKQIQVHIDDLQEVIREAFGELKKFEIAEEKRKDRLKQEAASKDNKNLDEIALSQFSRKNPGQS